MAEGGYDKEEIPTEEGYDDEETPSERGYVNNKEIPAEGGFNEENRPEPDDDEFIFAYYDGEVYKEEFMIACTFARDLFKDVFLKYGCESFLNADFFKDEDAGIELSPYCEHIGEAVIVVSYSNRLKLKVMFDQVLPFMRLSDFHFEKVALGFVKSIYVEGFVEQFLIVCSFFIEFTLYLCLKLMKNFAESMCVLFGDMFRYIMRETFYKIGGWSEVKRQSRPWWHTYRNYYYNRELEMLAKGPNAKLAYNADLHKPLLELDNDNFTALMIHLGHPTEIKTMRTYPDVPLADIVPRPGSSFSPICDDTPSEARLEPEGKESEEKVTENEETTKKAEGKVNKTKPKRKHGKGKKKSKK